MEMKAVECTVCWRFLFDWRRDLMCRQTYSRWAVDGHIADEEDNPAAADKASCRNKSADLIILSPARNPHNSGWYWDYDVQGSPSPQSTARAVSVTTNI